MPKSKKPTKKQQAIWDAESEARLAAMEAFRERFYKRPFIAEVIWFDRMSGEGMVRGRNGEGSFFLYACNIPGKKTWFPETACVYFEPGARIDVEVRTDAGNLLVSHTPGIIDQAKWDSLDQDKLAFKCNEQGEPINGLFA